MATISLRLFSSGKCPMHLAYLEALADVRQLVSSVATLPFLSSSLAFALVYIWSRRNPSVKMSLFGIITYV